MHPTNHHRYEIRLVVEERWWICIFCVVKEVKIHQQLWIDEADARINEWRDVPMHYSISEAFY